jgi:hypothetical protein
MITVFGQKVKSVNNVFTAYNIVQVVNQHDSKL